MNDLPESKAERLSNLLTLAWVAVAANDLEQADRCATEALALDSTNFQAWRLRAIATAGPASLADPHLQQALIYFAMAETHAPVAEKAAVRKEAASLVSNYSTVLYQTSQTLVVNTEGAELAWTNHVNCCEKFIAALEAAALLDPDNITVMKNIIFIAVDNIAGVLDTSVAALIADQINIRGVSNEYRSKLLNTIEKYTVLIREREPDYSPPTIRMAQEDLPAARKKVADGIQEAAKEGTCFIATATAGHRNPRVVEDLHGFREEVLRPSRLGALLTVAYHRVSPPLAKLLYRSKILNAVVYGLVVLPMHCTCMVIRRMTSRNWRSGSRGG